MCYKKLYAGLVGLVAFATVASSDAATGTALINADVLPTSSISASVGLNFGELTAGPIAGTVTVGPDGARTSAGGVDINSSSISSPATFRLVGAPNGTFDVILPASVTITDPNGNIMVVDRLQSQPMGSGVLDASGEQVLVIGGTLNVSANQVFGTYSGVMNVTITYN
jgi:hypothetical protein